MNLQLCRIVLRPRGPLACFDLGFRLIRVWWAPLWRLGAATVLPAWALCCAVGWLVGWSPWAVALPIALGPLVQAPFTLLVGRLLFAERVPWRELLSDLRERFPKAVGGTAVLALWAVTVPLCGLGIALAPSVLYVPECALLEPKVGPVRAARRSSRLANGHPAGSVTGAAGRWLLLLWCVAVTEAGGQALVSYVLQANLPIPGALEGSAGPWVLLGALLSHPLWAIWRLMLYVDARTRLEGWDLQVGLRAAGLAR